MHRVSGTPDSDGNSPNTSLDANSSNSDGRSLKMIQPANLRGKSAIQKTSRASALRNAGVRHSWVSRSDVPWRIHAFPIAHVLSVAGFAGCIPGWCAGSPHPVAQEKQIHAGATVESRRRGSAQ